MTRRPHDFYPTPAKAVEWLFRHWKPRDCEGGSPLVVEPCAGDGALVRAIEAAFAKRVVIETFDLDPERAWALADARSLDVRYPRPDGVITNPPFNQAIDIVRNFVGQGVPCAFLLRLSFLEPTEARGPWLAAHPPTGLIVCPRISFTGDRKTGSVTTAWMLWNTAPLGIVIIPKEE